MAATGVRPRGFRPWEITALLKGDVLDQHADDAAFLWSARDRAVRAPQYRLKDLLRLDERVEANLEGLRAAGEIGQALAAKRGDPKIPGTVFVTTVLALETSSIQPIRSLLEFCLRVPESLRLVLSGLGWARFEQAQSTLDWLLELDQPLLRSLGLRGYAIHRKDPGDLLRSVITDADPRLRCAAFRSAGELGRTELAHIIARALLSEEGEEQYVAAWTCARLGIRDPDVLQILRSTAESASPHADNALRMALSCMKAEQAAAWLRSLLADSRLLRRGITGIGALGDPAFLPDLLQYMQVDQLSRVAGESFSLLTGMDLKFFDLDRDRPEGFEAGPTDDPSDPVVAMDPDEDLAWPAPERVRAWCDQHGNRFTQEKRHLRGQPQTEETLTDALRNGYQRQRAAAALELAVLHPSDPFFNVQEPAARQQKNLDHWRLG